MMKTREQIVAETLTWLETPYHHEAMVKGSGVDCAMINIAIFRDFAGIIPADFDPRPYPMQWHLHRNEEKYLNWFTKYARKVDAPQIADIALFKFGRTVSHSGIIVAPGIMAHAYREAGRFILENVSAHESRLDSYWSIF